ncbi:MAG: hypothetical protein DRO94_03175 [Candidatus Altiarchaeales archaeon]|nr:MAG: hypothetical protein DRO94_03175 [Candidatus Altiarchaeales archaeon]
MKYWIIFMLILSECNIAGAISIGTAPGVYDLGELKPGSDVAFRFYLMTNAKSDVLVGLSYTPVHRDMYYRNQTGRYTFIPSEASEEDISSWVEIPRNPLLLSPGRTKIVYLARGGVVKANEEADIILHIPEDAEPGYHAGSISLSPRIGTVATRGTGIATIAVTRFVFVFRITGEAKRDGEIMSIIGDRISKDKAKIDVLFKNTGTCTISAYVSELKLYDKFGNLTAKLKSGIQYIKPGQIKPLTAYWVGDVIPGTYRAEARVDYITGEAVFEDRVEIPVIIKVRPKPMVEIPKKWRIPWLYILLIIIMIILFIYWLKSD